MNDVCRLLVSSLHSSLHFLANIFQNRANVDTFLYFAYGSNMLRERLQARCPSAMAVEIAIADGQKLAFSKRSIDGSGKGTLLANKQSAVYGVLFRIQLSERPLLDDFEGQDYFREDAFLVRSVASGQERSVTIYSASATALDYKLAPFDWYLDLVIEGARQNGLPIEYIQTLEATPNIPDQNVDRPRRVDAILLLQKVRAMAAN